jgi:hypothetical protein
MSQIEINNNINSVNVENTFSTVDVNNDISNILVVPQQITSVVEIVTPGPQGPPGPAGSGSFADTGSFVTTSSFNAFTSSYNTGSFTGSFIGTFVGDGSGLTGLPTSKWTGSADGSISRNSDVYVTGSFGVTNQSNTSLFLINAQGATSIKSTADDIFLVKNQNNVNVLTVSQSGVIVVATQSVELSNPAPNGGIYFTSNSFFVGLD